MSPRTLAHLSVPLSLSTWNVSRGLWIQSDDARQAKLNFLFGLMSVSFVILLQEVCFKETDAMAFSVWLQRQPGAWQLSLADKGAEDVYDTCILWRRCLQGPLALTEWTVVPNRVHGLTLRDDTTDVITIVNVHFDSHSSANRVAEYTQLVQICPLSGWVLLGVTIIAQMSKGTVTT